MTYSRYYTTWQDWPNTATPITAAAMQHIETGIVDAGTGGSPVVARTEYRNTNGFNVVTGTNATIITWVLGPNTGYEVLDLTDPQAPAVIEEGIYAVTATVLGHGDSGGPWNPAPTSGMMLVNLTLSANVFGWVSYNSQPLVPTANFNPWVTLSLTNWLGAGETMDLRMFQDSGMSLLFDYYIAVQKIT